METLALFGNNKGPFQWDYDRDADTLYLSFGPPAEAVGIDAGDGVIIRFDEIGKKVVGLTIVGVGHRIGDLLELGNRAGT